MRNQRILQNLINANLYEFLNSLSNNDFNSTSSSLRLSVEQYNFLEEMYNYANSFSENEFKKILAKKILENKNIYPLTLDPGDLYQDCDLSYRQFLQGKRVVLVGPSISLIGTSMGKVIESYDYVARMNFQWPISENLKSDLGNRMDILYHCCNGDYSINKILINEFAHTKFVCHERNIDSRVLKRYCDTKKIDCLDITNLYLALKEKLNSPPNTGTVAITHLLQFEISELFITGISFFQEPYYPGYLGNGAKTCSDKELANINVHHIAPQIKYCRELIAKDSRVVVDNKLKEIFGKL